MLLCHVLYLPLDKDTIISVIFPSDSLTHGQDFSHMIAQPTIINVQLEDEDEKGIEVGHVTTPTHNIIIVKKERGRGS